MTSGKPYLAMLCHQDTVRVLLTVKTMSTMTDTRVDQFISDERHRNIGEGAEVTDEEEMVDGGGRMEGLREEEEGEEEEEEVAGFSKSLTPSLLDPSLIASVDLVSGTNSLPKQGGVATTSCGRRRLGSSRSDSALAAAGDCSSLDCKGMFRTRQEEDKIEFGVQVVKPEEVDCELNQPRENGCEDHQGSSSKLGLAREERLLISIEDTVLLQRETELEENGETQLDHESIEKVVRSYSLIGEDEISPKTKVEGDLMNFNGEGFESSPPPDVDIPFATGDFTEEGTRKLLSSREEGEDSPDGEEQRNDKTTPQEIADIDSEPRYEMACFYDDSQLNSSEVETPTLNNNNGGGGEEEGEEGEGEGEDLSTMRRIPTPEIEETIYELVAPDDDGSTLRGGREGGSDASPATERERRSASPYETPSTLERTGECVETGGILL